MVKNSCYADIPKQLRGLNRQITQRAALNERKVAPYHVFTRDIVQKGKGRSALGWAGIHPYAWSLHQSTRQMRFGSAAV